MVTPHGPIYVLWSYHQVVRGFRKSMRYRAMFVTGLKMSEPWVVISEMDTIRNILGHYATTSREDMSKRLIQSAKALLERMCKHGSCSLTLNEIERQVQPPRRFLGT